MLPMTSILYQGGRKLFFAVVGSGRRKHLTDANPDSRHALCGVGPVCVVSDPGDLPVCKNCWREYCHD